MPPIEAAPAGPASGLSRPSVPGAGVLFALTILLAAAVPASAGAPDAAMRFDFTWAGTRACSAGAKSPAMSVTGVPEGTTRLRFTLRTSSGTEILGTAFVPYRGQAVVAQGELDMRMPCRSGDYTWVLTATDRNDAPLAGAQRTVPFP